MSLKGKTLFISGASHGIGLAIAVRAARDGAKVAIAQAYGASAQYFSMWAVSNSLTPFS